MKLSIIVPVYNMVADGKLAFCLDSLAGQHLEDYEIIAVDDASTDNSLEVLREYADKYPGRFVIVPLAENHRQGGAKNAGLDIAQGEFVGFVDSDDFIDPDMYARMLAKAEETGADMVGCNYCITYEHSFVPGKDCHNNKESQTGILDEDKYRSLILDHGSLVIKIYKRELFENPRLRFPEHMFYEDNAVAASLMLRVKHFEHIPEPLYYYYQHNASTVHVVTEERCRNRMTAMEYMMQELRSTPELLEKYYPEIEFRFTNLYYQNTLFSYARQKKGVRLGFLRELAKGMKQTFPEFQKNHYFLERVNAEERKFMAIQQYSSLLFLLYYKLVWWVRDIKSR